MLALVLSPEQTNTLAAVVVTLAAGGALLKLLLPLARGYGKRLEGSPAAGELQELRARVTALEACEARVADLEERLDFTERLLARQESTRLADPRAG